MRVLRPVSGALALLLLLRYLQASHGALALGPQDLLRFGALRTPPSWPADLPRLFLGPLLHVDALHLAVNAGLLLLFGAVGLEDALSRRRFLGLFLLGGLGGSVGALCEYRLWPTLDRPALTCGASGALLALCGAGLFLRVRALAPPRRLLLLLVTAGLLGSGGFAGGAPAAHLGGLAVGLLCALFTSSRWRTPCPRPRSVRAAGGS